MFIWDPNSEGNWLRTRIWQVDQYRPRTQDSEASALCLFPSTCSSTIVLGFSRASHPSLLTGLVYTEQADFINSEVVNISVDAAKNKY